MTAFVRPGIFLLALLLAGCQQDDTRNASVITSSPSGQSTAPPAAAAAERQNALIRVVHAIPAGASVDVYADANRVFDSLGYKTVTPYRELSGQRFDFALRPAGMALAEPLASDRESLDPGDHYTIFALPGEETAAHVVVSEDQHVAPSSANARVRLVQASRDAGAVDLFSTQRAEPLFTSIGFQSVTDYEEVAPSAGNLEVRPSGEPTAMLMLQNVRLEAGKTYTVVIVGALRTGPTLEAFVIEDRVAAAPEGR